MLAELCLLGMVWKAATLMVVTGTRSDRVAVYHSAEHKQCRTAWADCFCLLADFV
jgi:hypothetical protein